MIEIKTKNLPLFVTNDFVVGLGNSIFTILIMWYVYDVTQMAIATAIIGSLTHVSSFFAGPIAGVYADRSDKPLSLLRWALRINGLIVVVMIAGVYFLSDNYEIWAIFILVALREITFSFENPAQTRVMPMLVPQDSLSKLIGYRSVSSNIANLLGNAIAGFLYAALGIIGGLVFNSVTFFIGTFILSFLTLLTPKERGIEADDSSEEPGNQEQAAAQQKSSMKNDMKEGFKYLWTNKHLKRIAIIAVLINITSMIMPMFVVYFNEFLDSSANAYGFFNASLTAGSLLSGLIIGKVSKQFKNSTIVVAGWASLAALLLVMFFEVPILVTYLLGLLLGMGLTLPNITFETIQVLIVPDQYRGRTQTIMQAMSVVLIPLSNLAGGAIADTMGANYVFLFAGIWQTIIVLFVFLNRETFNVQDT